MKYKPGYLVRHTHHIDGRFGALDARARIFKHCSCDTFVHDRYKRSFNDLGMVLKSYDKEHSWRPETEERHKKPCYIILWFRDKSKKISYEDELREA